DAGRPHCAGMARGLLPTAPGKMTFPYKTCAGRTPNHTVLIHPSPGEDRAPPPPMDFPKQPWLDNFRAAGLSFADITHVFCTHLHIDHTGWNTLKRDGRWVPTFPNAKYIFHKGEYAYWEAATARGAN